MSKFGKNSAGLSFTLNFFLVKLAQEVNISLSIRFTIWKVEDKSMFLVVNALMAPSWILGEICISLVWVCAEIWTQYIGLAGPGLEPKPFEPTTNISNHFSHLTKIELPSKQLRARCDFGLTFLLLGKKSDRWKRKKKNSVSSKFLFDQRSWTKVTLLCHLVSNWSKLLSKKIWQTIPNDIFDISLFSQNSFGLKKDTFVPPLKQPFGSRVLMPLITVERS